MADYRELIRKLRAKADSTTFPAEAATFRKRADEIEAKHCRPAEPAPPPFFLFGSSNFTGNFRNGAARTTTSAPREATGFTTANGVRVTFNEHNTSWR
jgi:hypothetical protein